MVCPICASETDVINSREQKRSNQVWRRRRCRSCQSTFTTHEAAYLPQLFKVKSKDKTEILNPSKLYSELLFCLRGRKTAEDDARELMTTVLQKLIKKTSDGLILSPNISQETAAILKRFDKQAYLRFVAEHPSLF